MIFIHCDKCSKPHRYTFDKGSIELTCQQCNHTDIYHYVNCQFYSFFISKSKLDLYNIKLDKKQEYKSLLKDTSNNISFINIKSLECFQRKKSTRKNLDQYIESFPRVTTLEVLNNEYENLHNKESNYKFGPISMLLYNALSNLYARYC